MQSFDLSIGAILEGLGAEQAPLEEAKRVQGFACHRRGGQVQ